MKHIRSIPEPDPAAAVLWRVVADTQPDSAIWARLADLEAQLSALTAASAFVGARVWRASNQSIQAGQEWADVLWSTAAYEAGAEFWTSGPVVSVPLTGYYQVFCEGTFDGAGLLASKTGYMRLLAGASVIGDDEKTLMPGAQISLWCMAQRHFVAGTQIKAQVRHNDVSALNMLAQGDHSPDLIISRIG